MSVINTSRFKVNSLHPTESLYKITRICDQNQMKNKKRVNSQGVVSICSPVKTALAPAMKHIACSDSASVFLPAANLIIVVGNTMRAVAIVRISVWYGTALTKNQHKFS